MAFNPSTTIEVTLETLGIAKGMSDSFKIAPKWKLYATNDTNSEVLHEIESMADSEKYIKALTT